MMLAHAGHWYHSLLYLAPVLLVSAALWWSGRGDTGAASDEPPDEDLLEPEGGGASDEPGDERS